MSATLRPKSPLLREHKITKDCCQISEELSMTLNELKIECSGLRSKDRDFAYILETLIFMDKSFQQQSEEKRKMKKQFSSKIESNKSSISTLRRQIDEQKILLIEKKMSMVEYMTEFEETQSSSREGGTEFKQLESSLVLHKEQNQTLQKSKKTLEEQLYELRELNSNDICEINKLKYELDQQSKGVSQMEIDEKSQEQLITFQNGKIQSMENKLEQKLIELDDKAFLLEETEAEIYQYETQIESFQRELEHLKDMEQKYLQENEDLYYRIQEESQKNMELQKQVITVETKVTKLESKLTFMKQKSEANANSKATQVNANNKLQEEIDSLQNHIRVITNQNEELTRELDHMVKANERIREQIDRKDIIQQITSQNEQNITTSIRQYQNESKQGTPLNSVRPSGGRQVQRTVTTTSNIVQNQPQREIRTSTGIQQQREIRTTTNSQPQRDIRTSNIQQREQFDGPMREPIQQRREYTQKTSAPMMRETSMTRNTYSRPEGGFASRVASQNNQQYSSQQMRVASRSNDRQQFSAPRQEFRTIQSSSAMESRPSGGQGGHYVITQASQSRQTGQAHPQGYRMVDRDMSPTVTRTRIVERRHMDQIVGDQEAEEIQYIVEERQNEQNL